MRETKMELKAKKLVTYYMLAVGTFSLIVLLTYIANITFIQSLGFFLIYFSWAVFFLWAIFKSREKIK
jgi:hypothetical protein